MTKVGSKLNLTIQSTAIVIAKMTYTVVSMVSVRSTYKHLWKEIDKNQFFWSRAYPYIPDPSGSQPTLPRLAPPLLGEIIAGRRLLGPLGG